MNAKLFTNRILPNTFRLRYVIAENCLLAQILNFEPGTWPCCIQVSVPSLVPWIPAALVETVSLPAVHIWRWSGTKLHKVWKHVMHSRQCSSTFINFLLGQGCHMWTGLGQTPHCSRPLPSLSQMLPSGGTPFHKRLCASTWYPKQPFFNGCLVKQPVFNVMIGNHPMQTTKKTGCLEFQAYWN